LFVLALVIFTARSSSLKNPIILLVLFGVSAMLMSAINNVITSIIPLYMREKMDSGLLAGVLDTFCYVGSTLSTALLGFIADNSGWSGVFNCLLVFGAIACAACWLSAAVEKRNNNRQNN
jgi:sugar phosphate permease